MSVPVERLKRRSEFLRVAGARRRWVTPGMIVQVLNRQPDGAVAMADGLRPLRYGLTVSRKVGSAVARNRARRRLRAAAQALLPHHGRAGLDIVLIGRGTTLTRDYRDLLDDLSAALRRLDAWTNDDPACTP